MPKTKAPSKTKKAKKAAANDHHHEPEHRTAERVMETVLKEQHAEASTERLDQWVNIECPHCGEGTELHVIADMDGQTIDQDCGVCARSYVAHVEIDEGDVHVGTEAA